MTNTSLTWKTSTRSSGGDNCIEVALATNGENVAVRDSKDRTGPTLQVTAAQWATFLTAIHRDQLIA